MQVGYATSILSKQTNDINDNDDGNKVMDQSSAKDASQGLR